LNDELILLQLSTAVAATVAAKRQNALHFLHKSGRQGVAVQILIVEDHALVREGLIATLKVLGRGVRILGAADATEASQILEQEDIDLMLLDLMLPGTKGQTFLPVVRRRFPTVPVVVLSALDDPDTVAGVMKNGASGFISKSASSEELLDALQQVLAGDVYVHPDMRDAISRRSSAKAESGRSVAQRFGLTAGQERVLDHLAEGTSNRQIAELLGLTEGTVKIHVSAIIKALKVTNRAEAALIASRKKKA
jgi:DNA-binding NarL/FixJ family response regulator